RRPFPCAHHPGGTGRRSAGCGGCGGAAGSMSRPRRRGSDATPALQTRLIGRVGGALLSTLMRTTRLERSGTEHYDAWIGSGRTAIYVLWHGRLLPCSYFHRHQGLATLISQHRDGDYIAGVVERWG